MKVELQVIEGAQPATPLHFEGTEPKNVIVGRADAKGTAEWQLSKEDGYVSRSHFLLEIRPPNCMLRDPLSMNGTYLRRGDRPEERVEEVLLQNGDRIRVGHTALSVNIVLPVVDAGDMFISGDSIFEERTIKDEEDERTVREPREAPHGVFEELRKGPDRPELRCIRCGRPLEDVPAVLNSGVRDLDFMCARCRADVEADQAREAEKHAAVQYTCAQCGKDITAQAQRDARAVDLHDVAFYLCESCAGAIRRKAMRNPDHRPDEKRIGEYRLLRKLGEGGMGVVYQVWHEETGRVAALKRMLPVANGQPRLVRRFHREMSIMQDLRHPNLVRLFEGGQTEDSSYFISEFVTGGDLTQFISDNGKPLLSPQEVVDIIADALVGLDFFHTRAGTAERKYVHRDLKPENILIERHNGTLTAKIADFGLSKCYEESGGTTTRTGEYAGTIMYMPPEQITSFKAATPPVDIYAMGVTIYYLLTGQFPLDFPSPWKMKRLGGVVRLKKPPLNMVRFDERTPIRRQRQDLPPALCRVVDRAVQRAAKDRYQTAEELREALLRAVR